MESIHQAWQSTGDDAWLASQLPAMEKALHYAMSSDIRWSSLHQLVKRPFGIDTWDFAYNPRGKYKRESYGDIDEHTTYCIMHGDNSGMYQATNHLAKLYRHLGRSERADYWQSVATGFRERTNRLCWNGNFYTHQIHIDPVEVEGVDERDS